MVAKNLMAKAIVKPYRKPERYESVEFELMTDGSLWYLTKYRAPERVESIQMVNKKRVISDQWDRCAKIELDEKTIWIKKSRAQSLGIIPKEPSSPRKTTVELNKVDKPKKQTIPLTLSMSHYMVIKRKAEKSGLSIQKYITNRLPKK